MIVFINNLINNLIVEYLYIYYIFLVRVNYNSIYVIEFREEFFDFIGVILLFFLLLVFFVFFGDRWGLGN